MSLYLNSEATEKCLEKALRCPHTWGESGGKNSSFWSKRSNELETNEKALHDGPQPHLRYELHGKRLLVFKEKLDSFGYQDKTRVKDTIAVFPVRWLPKSHVFPVEWKKAGSNHRGRFES